MTASSQDFLGSVFNFFEHKSSYRVYTDSVIHSGLPIDNSLGLCNPLSLIFEQSGRPAMETNDENIFWLPFPITGFSKDKDALTAEVKKRVAVLQAIYTDLSYWRTSSGAPSVGEAINLIHPFRWYAYGHLHDSLTKLFSIREQDINRDNIVYLVADPLRIKDFSGHLSALAGHVVPDEQIINIGKYSSLSVETLWQPNPPSIPTAYTREAYNWVIDSYFKYFKIYETEPVESLYLSRNNVRAGSRQVVNEAEVIQYLKSRGFRVVTGDEPLSEIVGIFSSAKFVIGAHGSLFANTIFCPKSCCITEYCPANRIDKSIQYKYKQASAYHQVLVEADDNFNITIPIDSLKDLLG